MLFDKTGLWIYVEKNHEKSFGILQRSLTIGTDGGGLLNDIESSSYT